MSKLSSSSKNKKAFAKQANAITKPALLTPAATLSPWAPDLPQAPSIPGICILGLVLAASASWQLLFLWQN